MARGRGLRAPLRADSRAQRTACDGPGGGRSAGRRGPRGLRPLREGLSGRRREGCGARPALAGPGPEPCRPARPGPAEAAAPSPGHGRTRSKLPELPSGAVPQAAKLSGTPILGGAPRRPHLVEPPADKCLDSEGLRGWAGADCPQLRARPRCS